MIEIQSVKKNLEDLTKKDVKDMSQEEIFFWGEQFAKKEKEEALRKLILEQLEIKEAKDIIE